MVQDCHRAAEEDLGGKRGTQTQEQRHSNFSNLVLCGNFRKAVRYICDRETGGFLLPNKQATESTGLTYKTVLEVLAGKNPPEKKTIVLHFKHMR